ncbi:UDP-2,3-diacylglucosamine diphosphatase [Legionella waltersii]|uniref:UDP-2,3-diacylglucosamine hydrolase n=1 Tax=Legionella waltersii TaxID=66969 RepID=A0A0W1A137_9GAMM|nr:UDP-2,3-diacylglucosamine diphosphatase [Legionella waltersii]KTD75044.1 UDP-2,3-diacylglucosamine hydrolase [Legionella waltersii]SNV05395.1 UDP-2,3-diacylglucosamine hydrolase [Legionella waltersii]
MIDAVFISDLHLSPSEPEIKERFNGFIAWAESKVKSIYILGDFFHAWAGDDSLDDWSLGIANQLKSLVDKGINIYFMAGNRDFLLGERFAKLSGWRVLQEPTKIQLHDRPVLLVHGDRYCTKDIAHQRFRKLTRNRFFSCLFLALPLSMRLKLVEKIRKNSSSKRYLSSEQIDVVTDQVTKHLKSYNVNSVIHGHTHKSGEHTLHLSENEGKRYVLSDWDDNPTLLCYDITKGFYFAHVNLYHY